MNRTEPANAGDVRKLVRERLAAALESSGGTRETTTIEWRGTPQSFTVIAMPVGILKFNPDTHRIRAQRSHDPAREALLETDPFGAAAQQYLRELLMGDPEDPSRVDPAFTDLRDDLAEHSQTDPGLITRSGIVVNGNTRLAALLELGQDNIRVGILPEDASHDDIDSVELALQLREVHKRDYSFMNLLLAIDERRNAGKKPPEIQAAFHIKSSTFERNCWILDFIREAIRRSEVTLESGAVSSLRLVDFEKDKGKLEELHRKWASRKNDNPDEADLLREQRLTALALEKSKTDLRLIDVGFASTHLASVLPEPPVKTSRSVPGLPTVTEAPRPAASAAVAELTNNILRARAVKNAGARATPAEIKAADTLLAQVNTAVDKGLDAEGRNARLRQKKLAAVDRLENAADEIQAATAAVVEARSKGALDPDDLDEPLTALRDRLRKLNDVLSRIGQFDGVGASWLRAATKAAD